MYELLLAGLGAIVIMLIGILVALVGWFGSQLHKRMTHITEALVDVKTTAHDDFVSLRDGFSSIHFELKGLDDRVSAVEKSSSCPAVHRHNETSHHIQG